MRFPSYIPLVDVTARDGLQSFSRWINTETKIQGDRSARAVELYPGAEFGFHVHNLSGMGAANILAALDAGASWLEGATCGIDGGIAMPNTLGSVGNYPSEDLARLLEVCRVQTDVTAADALAAAKDVAAMLEMEPRTHSFLGYTREEIQRRPDKSM